MRRRGLVGSSVQILVAAPDHVPAEFLAHDLHLVLAQGSTLGVEEGTALALVLSDPVAGEGAVLDVGQNCAHAGLGLLIGENAGAG